MTSVHDPAVHRRNARRGALKNQCPNCQRKAAMSALHKHGDSFSLFFYRECRYCHYFERQQWFKVKGEWVKRRDSGIKTKAALT